MAGSHGVLGGLLSVVLTGAAALCGCTESKDAYAQLRTPHVTLISGFESYITSAEARRRLPGELPVRVLSESKLTVSDRRPRFDRLTLSVSGFEHVGFTGDLELHFLNDRLMSTNFCPAEYDSYLGALWVRGVRFSATHADVKGRSCVDWVDYRLVDEEARWISRYS